jgi:hypothetical protein
VHRSEKELFALLFLVVDLAQHLADYIQGKESALHLLYKSYSPDIGLSVTAMTSSREPGRSHHPNVLRGELHIPGRKTGRSFLRP